ncbi:hypothetical protein E4U43_001072 [Claviceps pusilla]|uniref:Uncharacterized protein n=1 Tax=Claviceps pusilla TaxID=123648 RepID=A0A9P7NG76_9HYPO|nr:hypothetical protein E4U43_001072 [Claviceps pusilla]
MELLPDKTEEVRGSKGVPAASAGLNLLRGLASVVLTTMAPGFDVSTIFIRDCPFISPSNTPELQAKRFRAAVATTFCIRSKRSRHSFPRTKQAQEFSSWTLRRGQYRHRPPPPPPLLRYLAATT